METISLMNKNELARTRGLRANINTNLLYSGHLDDLTAGGWKAAEC
jgi:hypothetical protein